MVEPVTEPVPGLPLPAGASTDDAPTVPRLAAAAAPRFELQRRIGAGNHGVVFQAHDHQLGRTVAIKRFSHFLADDPRAMRRITREVETLARVSHPHVVTVHDLVHMPDGDGEVTPHLVMELVEGTSLRALLDAHGPSSRAAVVVAGVLEGLSACHRAGILHLDIKPANVLVTQAGGVKIVDFGIARAASDGTATVAGTPHYMAPEQYEGRADERSDVYSVGCLLFECLTGSAPFQGPMAAQLLAHRTQPRPDPRERSPWVGAGLAEVVRRAMSIDPEQRFQSVDEMLTALRPVADDVVAVPAAPVATEPVAEPQDQPVEPSIGPALETVRSMTRLRWLLSGLAVSAFVVALVPTLVWSLGTAVSGRYVPDAMGGDAKLALWFVAVGVAILLLLGRRAEFFGALSGPRLADASAGALAPHARRGVALAAKASLGGSLPLMLPFYALAVGALTGALGLLWPDDVYGSAWGIAWLLMPLASVFLAVRALSLARPRLGSLLLALIHLGASGTGAVLFVVYPAAVA